MNSFRKELFKLIDSKENLEVYNKCKQLKWREF
jgi:hypothetical protein